MLPARNLLRKQLLTKTFSTLAPWFHAAGNSRPETDALPLPQERADFANLVDFDAWVGNSPLSLANDASAMRFELIDPTTKQHLSTKYSSSCTTEAAVNSAESAFHGWASTPGSERAKILRSIAQGIRKHSDCLISLEALCVGKPIPEASWDVQDAASCFEYMASLAEVSPAEQRSKLPHVEDGMLAESTFMPLGPVAVIVPWNYPLLMAVWKVAPALAAGCSVVLKPSEYTPQTALLLGKIAAEAGLPSGVLNVIGGGGEAGASIAGDRRFGKVAFTGSSRAGRAVMAAAAPNTTPVSLELGGKSSAIVFADAVDTDEKLTAVA
jgi:betaine-aldehyde dehydrogenase